MRYKSVGLPSFLVLLLFQIAHPISVFCDQHAPSADGNWTILIYAGVDSSSESHLMPHLEQLAEESKQGQSSEIILFIDRSPQYSNDATILGEDFADSRLFRLNSGNWHRVGGGEEFPEITVDSKYEANSGDAETLRSFIRFGKQSSPSTKYALILFGHGECRFVCPDEGKSNEDLNESLDPMYTAEITDCLTGKESVDLLWVDACAFGGIENVYQFRQSNGDRLAKVMLASPPTSSPAPMSAILANAGMIGASDPGKAQPKDPVEFGKSAIASIRAHYKRNRFKGMRESWAAYDVGASHKVKSATDRLAVALARGDNKTVVERLRGNGRELLTMSYMRRRTDTALMWVVAPYFDLYDLASRLATSKELDSQVRRAAAELQAEVENLVIDSFGGSSYKGFQPGKHGIFIVFPDGDSEWRNKPQWASFQWYHPHRRVDQRYAYGGYDWCADGAQSANGKVENWFELLDHWFDDQNESGDSNQYQY